MLTKDQIGKLARKLLVINTVTVVVILVLMCAVIVSGVYYTQKWSEESSFTPIVSTGSKEQLELAKLGAEIRQIRSDTTGSLFWLKMIGVFVTVCGAVGGYLLGQSRIAKRKIAFENRKNVDAVYQTIVQELLDKEKPLLRATAAVKMGAILESFPPEWVEDTQAGEETKRQMIQLTKKVLAASLALEKDEKVLKTVSIALVLHKPGKDEAKKEGEDLYADARGLDLSGAKANDAYWRLVDFSESDFYGASLEGTSFRKSLLSYAQFREALLSNAVFVGADCSNANFKLADLRRTDFTKAKLVGTRFENAKVYDCQIADAAEMGDNYPDDKVDDSVEGNGARMITVREWLERETKQKASS